MPLVNFTNLDYDQIRLQIRDYLKNKTTFTDYNFEGSNLSTIIDLLAYNTYISSYNANMLSNEVFIDSATLRENVVSLARNIGYVPRSTTSSRANISFFVDISELYTSETDSAKRPLTLTLQKGLVCSSSVFGDTNYTYSIPDGITVPIVQNIATFNNIEVIEGTPITDNFTVDSTIPNQKFILTNSNIDTSTINVYIRDNLQSTSFRKFIQSNNLFNVESSSKVFFIQEIEDQQYELIFGDGIFGQKLENGNIIEVTYNISSGSESNGASSFSFIGRIVDNQDRLVSSNISLITTSNVSYGGKEIESTEYVRKYAPRIYSAQNRAVTSLDYEALIPQIYSEVESVSVFGGEELSPPRFGKVFITIKPTNGQFIPNSIKENIKLQLRSYNVAGIIPEILDLKYLYIEYNSKVYFNQNKTRSSSEVLNTVSDNIISYSKSSELNSYGSRFKYSKFLKIIDDSHNAVTSNITSIQIRRDLRVVLNNFASYELCYGNEFYVNSKEGFNVKSSGFKVSGILDTLYLTDIPNSDGVTGRIVFIKVLNNSNSYKIIRKNAGVIDYVKGEIKIYPNKFTETLKLKGSDNIIEISAIPKSNDIIGLQDLYLQLDVSNSNLITVQDLISSGNDISGTNYITSSSYSDNTLFRS
jgi:hypothetical protein